MNTTEERKAVSRPMTVSEVAAQLGCSLGAVYGFIHSPHEASRLRAYKLGSLKIYPEDLADFIRRRSTM